MRRLIWISLATASLGVKVSAQPAASNAPEDVINELLSYAVPAEDWQEHLQQRRRAGWAPPVMPPPGPMSSAAIKDLVSYWQRGSLALGGKPDAKTRGRLLAYCEEHPVALGKLAGWFVPTENDALNRMQKLNERLSGATTEQDILAREQVQQWLAIHAGMFRDKLEKQAERYFETPEDVELQAMFDAYMKHEPAAAKAMLARHAEDTAPGARCAALLRLHAMGDPQAEQWQEKLQALVSSNAPAGIRASALRRLGTVDWPEKTAWVLGLFKDASLGSIKVSEHSEDEPLALLVKQAPNLWVPKIIPLVGDSNRAVHDNAVRCLAQFHLEDKREDALRALLPWLSNPQWALNEEHEGRLRLVQSMEMVNMPESVPGLIWVLRHDTPFMRRVAASALCRYHVAEAVPVVRELAAQEPDFLNCRELLGALVELKGATIEEQVEAVEQLEAQLLTKEGQEVLEEEGKPLFAKERKGLDRARRLPVAMGAALSVSSWLQSDALAQALVKRARELRTANPRLANALEQRLSLWSVPTSRKLLVERLREGRFEAPWVARLFHHMPPKSMAEITVLSVPIYMKTAESSRLPEADLRALQDLPATTSSIVALLLRDEDRIDQILKGEDANAQAMLLACARLNRTPLPFSAAGRLLESPQAQCARAALLYLEAVDSPEARALVLDRFRGKAKILGAQWAHAPEDSSAGEMGRAQERLRQRVLTAKDAVEIHAMLSDSQSGGVGQIWIEVQGNTAVLFNEQGHGRYGTRMLTAAELAEVRAYANEQRVEELPPLTLSVMDGVQYEYLHLTADGGRRVFMNSPGAESRDLPAALLEEPNNPEQVDDAVYVRLVDLFEKLATDKSKMSVGYRLTEQILGFQILVPREKHEVLGVMQQPDGTLIANIRAHEGGSSCWVAVTADGALLPDKQVSGPILNLPNDGMPHDFEVRSNSVTMPWRASVAGGGMVQSAKRQEDGADGLWLCRDGQKPELMVPGSFGSPIASLDGRWLVAIRGADAEHGIPYGVVRVDVTTRAIIPLKMAAADFLSVEGRLPHSGKILVARHTYAKGRVPEVVEHHLVHPATGVLEQVVGEVIPLRDETWRPLQPTDKPGVAWAAVQRLRKQDNSWCTRIGRYDLNSLEFSQLIEVPDLYFTSMDFWVDEARRMIYLAKGQDLLSFPLPSEAQKKAPATD